MVLTGFNTDIDYSGTTYHVQTEDKGRSNPFLESLIYAHGEILYSRRTPYQDLVDEGVDPKTIASLMDKQHRTLVEAVRRGLLAQLMERGEAVLEAAAAAAVAPGPVSEPSSERSLDQVILDYLEAQKEQAHLVLQSTRDSDFVYGSVLAVEVVALNSRDQQPVPDAEVTVLFKSTAEPRRLLLGEGTTDPHGRFGATLELPPFNGGTSAVVIAARSELGQSEIKHLVHR